VVTMNKVQRHIIIGNLCEKYCKKKKCIKYEKNCEELDDCHKMNELKEIENYIRDCYYTYNHDTIS